MDAISQLWSLIRQLQGVLKFLVGLQINFGSTPITWPGSTDTATPVAIAHGLAETPKIAAAFQMSLSTQFVAYAYSLGATTFTVGARVLNSATPTAGATATVGWIAIG